MSRNLVVAIAALKETHRETIAAAAKQHGFTVRFFNSDQEALPALADAEIVFGQSAFLAQHAPRLRWLCTPSAGVDQFLAPGLFASPDAVLTNSSGAYGTTIAEHIVMVTLEMMRRQADYNGIVDRRAWKSDLPIRSIRGSRILMAGTGDIGQETAVRLRAFSPAGLCGMNRSGENPQGLFDRILTAADWETALPETDILILSLPGTKETRHMLGERQLSLLPDGAAVLNVGRGSVVDQRALEKELAAGRLFAGLDVFEREPPAATDPAWELENLVMTPHTAGNLSLPYTVQRVAELFLEDLGRYCRGELPARLVDRKKGY